MSLASVVVDVVDFSDLRMRLTDQKSFLQNLRHSYCKRSRSKPPVYISKEHSRGEKCSVLKHPLILDTYYRKCNNVSILRLKRQTNVEDAPILIFVQNTVL